MYLVMEDKSQWALNGLERGFSNKKYVEIPDELLELLNCTFIENLKSILRDCTYRYIKERKRKPNDGKALCLGCLVEKNSSSIPYFNMEEWKRDVRVVLSYFLH